MLVIPPGLSEEEEALQKKFNKLKKKVRECVGAWPNLSQTLHSETTWGECEGWRVLLTHTWRLSPLSVASEVGCCLVVHLVSFLLSVPWSCLPHGFYYHLKAGYPQVRFFQFHLMSCR